MWANKHIFLRPVEMADLPYLLKWENDPKNWEVSGTTAPFTEEEMINFIVEQTYFLSTGQLRLMICLNKKSLPIGAIDLFDINVEERSAGVGILIQDNKHRSKGYAKEALSTLKEISKSDLKLNRLTCSIHSNNHSSIALFTKLNFTKTTENQAIENFELIL